MFSAMAFRCHRYVRSSLKQFIHLSCCLCPVISGCKICIQIRDIFIYICFKQFHLAPVRNCNDLDIIGQIFLIQMIRITFFNADDTVYIPVKQTVLHRFRRICF